MDAAAGEEDGGHVGERGDGTKVGAATSRSRRAGGGWWATVVVVIVAAAVVAVVPVAVAGGGVPPLAATGPNPAPAPRSALALAANAVMTLTVIPVALFALVAVAMVALVVLHTLTIPGAPPAIAPTAAHHPVVARGPGVPVSISIAISLPDPASWGGVGGVVLAAVVSTRALIPSGRGLPCAAAAAAACLPVV